MPPAARRYRAHLLPERVGQRERASSLKFVARLRDVLGELPSDLRVGGDVSRSPAGHQLITS
jgi:hypothetical protein